MCISLALPVLLSGRVAVMFYVWHQRGNSSNGSTHPRPELPSIFNERTQGTCVDKSYSFKDVTSSAGLSVKVADGTCEEAFSLQSRNTAGD